MRKGSKARASMEMELFPFLSILACTIGTLILLIVAMSAQTVSDEREVSIIAYSDGNGVNKSKTPRYLECGKDGVIIYPSEVLVTFSELSNSNNPLAQLLQEISAKRHQEYLILAVKPDGIEVFKEVRYLIEQRGIDLGYEPFDEGWKLKVKEWGK